jgi:hypothetical protein
MADGREPEFGVRVIGYSRREVDEFVAEVRRELRGLDGGPDPDWDGRMTLAVRLADEEAAVRIADARERAEQLLRSARELADRVVADARRRAVDLEESVAAALDRELTSRVGELAGAHTRLIEGLTGMSESLAGLLCRDAELGPIRPLAPGGRLDERLLSLMQQQHLIAGPV